jgi:hypothetical protein
MMVTVDDVFNVDKMPTRGEKLSRTEREILIDIADLLVKQTAVLEHIRVALGQSAERRSSVEIKTSTRGVDIASKAYEGSPIIDAEGEAVASYFRVLNEVQERLANGGAAK